MESYNPVDLTPYDRNAAIADASEKQHRVNVERALHYLGLDPQGTPSIYAADDIYSFVDTLVTKKSDLQATSTNDPDQFTLDLELFPE